MINQTNYLWFAPSHNYKGGQPITIDKVLNDVAEEFKVSKEDILGKCRLREFVEARQVAQYIIREKMNNTLRTTGLVFGKKHCTIIHSIKNVEALIQFDKNFKRKVENIIVKNDFFRTYER